MKKPAILSLTLITFLFLACNSSKKESAALYGPTWELEYLSGPRIAFDGLFPDKKPQLQFNHETMKAEGSGGCNGYSADFSIEGNSISFGEPGPTTMMYCGEGETFFLNTIKKVNTFSMDSEGKLVLQIDDVAMMRFKKVE